MYPGVGSGRVQHLSAGGVTVDVDVSRVMEHRSDKLNHLNHVFFVSNPGFVLCSPCPVLYMGFAIYNEGVLVFWKYFLNISLILICRYPSLSLPRVTWCVLVVWVVCLRRHSDRHTHNVKCVRAPPGGQFRHCTSTKIEIMGFN